MKYLFLLLGLSTLLILSACQEKTEKSTVDNAVDTDATTAQKENPMLRKTSNNTNQILLPSEPVQGGVEWMSLEELQEVAKTDKRKVLIDVYTSWCGWCKVMDKKTFTDPEVKKYLEENFHTVKFNAEQKESIVFKGKEYQWKPSGRRGINMLAVELLNGRLGYPTIVYLDEDLNKIKSIPGYKTPAQLMADIKSL